jgi:hypothetical protein
MFGERMNHLKEFYARFCISPLDAWMAACALETASIVGDKQESGLNMG